MDSKFKGLCIIKNIIQNLRIINFWKKEYPCTGCIAIPGGCFDLCDKVEMDKRKLVEHFKKNSSICPDCGGKVSISQDGKDHMTNMYQQCEYCRHFFSIIYSQIIIPYKDIMRKQPERVIFKVDRRGH